MGSKLGKFGIFKKKKGVKRMELIKIVHDLRKAKGSKKKLRILKEHESNNMWKIFLKATLDKSVVYHVSAPKTFDFHDAVIDPKMFILFDKLASREISGKQSKRLAEKLSEEYGEIPRLILGRSIKAGVSIGLIKKAYPGLIEVFETMKGDDFPFKDFPLLSSIKYDGVKVFVESSPSGITLRTSSGAKFILEVLSQEFLNSIYGMYEGEMIFREGKQVHRSVITGKLNTILSNNPVDFRECSYKIYDWIPPHEWRNKKGKTSYRGRQKILNAQVNLKWRDSIYVGKVEQVKITEESEAVEFYESLIDMGYEGTISRYPGDVYDWTGNRRTDRIIKKKAIKKCVLKCIAITPHSNPSKGNIGSLICRGKILNKDLGEIEIDVNVGVGLSKFDRLSDPEKFIGEKIEVLYNTVTESNGKFSLFLPRYKRIKI